MSAMTVADLVAQQTLLNLIQQAQARLEHVTQRLATCEMALAQFGMREAGLTARVAELEKLWAIAKENPELVRELAAQALKGRDAA